MQKPIQRMLHPPTLLEEETHGLRIKIIERVLQRITQNRVGGGNDFALRDVSDRHEDEGVAFDEGGIHAITSNGSRDEVHERDHVKRRGVEESSPSSCFIGLHL